MNTNVEIISSETIKPSFPTPDNLKHYKRCNLDQTTYRGLHIPFVFFYPNNDAATHTQILERIDVLKKSLSETLTRIPPLAGTISDDEFFVDCDDRGASFKTARVVSGDLREFLGESPDLQQITQSLLPDITCTEYLTNIQTTVFEKCGGIVVGTCITHEFIDGAGLSLFFKTWSEIVRNISLINDSPSQNNTQLLLNYDKASSLFPATDFRVKEASMATWGSLFKPGGSCLTRRFVFDGSAVAALKSAAAKPCTKIEAVSAFIWKCAKSACQQKSPVDKSSLLIYAVNFRNRADPELSEIPLGNLGWMATARFTAEKGTQLIGSFPDTVAEVKKSIGLIDGEFVKKLKGDEGISAMVEFLKDVVEESSSEDVDYFGFISWCGLGFYETDFGWGKPVWVSHRDAGGPYSTKWTILTDTRCGKGIEAWMTYDEQTMAILENNKEFRAFASLNPSPL